MRRGRAVWSSTLTKSRVPAHLKQVLVRVGPPQPFPQPRGVDLKEAAVLHTRAQRRGARRADLWRHRLLRPKEPNKIDMAHNIGPQRLNHVPDLEIEQRVEGGGEGQSEECARLMRAKINLLLR